MLYVIRHGQVDTNVLKKVNGWNEEILNEIGIKQAKKIEKKVKKLNIDIIICSPLIRAKQTCDIINSNHIKVIYDDRLKERNSNDKTLTDVKDLDKNIWYDRNKLVVYNNSEGFKSIIERVFNLIDELKINYTNKNILLITHGDICKAINFYFNRNIKDVNEFSQKNCELISYNF